MYGRQTMESTGLRDFLEIPYDKLEEMNLEAKQQRIDRVPLAREWNQQHARTWWEMHEPELIGSS